VSALDQIDLTATAKRLKLARERAGIRQSDAAVGIGVARTTIVAIEQGQRRLRVNEIQQLARLYGTTVNALLHQESIHVDLAPRFRKLANSSSAAADEAVKLLCNLASAEAELENLLGVKRIRNFPPERPLLGGDLRAQAEQDSLELRQHLGLGVSPVPDIVTLLELELGVRVYIRRLDSMISGLFAYDEALGPCMLLNANHPRDRRTQSAAHECGHFVSARSDPDILHADVSDGSREERYANTFGRAFLMPARAVMQKFQETVMGSGILSRRHIIILAHFFGVSREAMVRRLEELSLTKDGTWDWFQANGGISDQQESQVLGDLNPLDVQRLESDRPTTLRLNLLAAEAYRQELLSEGQLSHLLSLDHVETRQILDSLLNEGKGADGVKILPH
jgi:Zn-dependent peptidase ImmA (M78 family)/DNA-binding XRE family transcriptional regulator